MARDKHRVFKAPREVVDEKLIAGRRDATGLTDEGDDAKRIILPPEPDEDDKTRRSLKYVPKRAKKVKHKDE